MEEFESSLNSIMNKFYEKNSNARVSDLDQKLEAKQKKLNEEYR